MAGFTLFEHENFGGHSDVFTGSDLMLSDNLWVTWNGWWPIFHNWDNQASSVKVYDGPVTFFENSWGGGHAVTLQPGYYPSLSAVGIANDSVSSVIA